MITGFLKNVRADKRSWNNEMTSIFGVHLALAVVSLTLGDHRRLRHTRAAPEHAPSDDALTAAIGQSVGMTVATRNTKRLEPLGVACLDPWGRG